VALEVDEALAGDFADLLDLERAESARPDPEALDVVEAA
jgi:hypothetical protein